MQDDTTIPDSRFGDNECPLQSDAAPHSGLADAADPPAAASESPCSESPSRERPVGEPAPLDSPPVAKPPLAVRPAFTAAAPRRSLRPLVALVGWLGAAVVVLLGTRYFVPNLAEEIQYAMTRGRLRAEHEVAGRELAASPLDDLSRSFQLVSKRVGPSVVHINTVSNDQPASDELAGLITPHLRVRQGQGSGVIVANDGFILTNYHVVRDSSSITVHLSDGSKRDAVEIGHDAATDLALLKIEADSLIPAEWGESGRMEVGSPVWAVGSPFGLEHSVTFGILSA
jgi:hypothetical protein